MARRLRVFLAMIVLSGTGSWLCAQAMVGKVSESAGDEAAKQPGEVAAEHVTLGSSAVSLTGPWKFQVGDSPVDPATGKPTWAEPGFDDSAWERVDMSSGSRVVDPLNGVTAYSTGWTMRGHPGYCCYAWYRMHVQLQSRPGDKLAIAGPALVDDVYQFFSDGKLVGSFGDFSGSAPVIFYSQPVMFALPDGSSGKGGERSLVLAVRMWMHPASLNSQPDAGGMHSPPVIGEETAVTAGYRLRWLALVRSYLSSVVLAAIFAVVALVSLSLRLFDRGDRAYLWTGAVFLVLVVQSLALALGAWSQLVNALVLDSIEEVIVIPLTYGLWAMVLWSWFRLERPVWIPGLAAAMAIMLAASNALGEDIFAGFVPHSLSPVFYPVTFSIRVAFLLLMLWEVFAGTVRTGWTGLLMLPAVLLLGMARFSTELQRLQIRIALFPFGVLITLSQASSIALAAVVLVLLMRRLTVSVGQQRRMAQDVKQAQELQQFILPSSSGDFPGLAIESVYRPAREVGGDFFQIVPHPADGSVLIVAGDVAGKGLQAGMLVALLVGAIRSTAEIESDPALMLVALNRRLIGRGNAFATCLALRIEATGQVELANAGHLPPYRNGRVLDVDGSLPLGLLEGAEFSRASFQLEEGDRLVLTSDGIVEAMNREGELFGFERMEQLLGSSSAGPRAAEGLADAAQRFGQEDDISVIAVTRTPGPLAALGASQE